MGDPAHAIVGEPVLGQEVLVFALLGHGRFELGTAGLDLIVCERDVEVRLRSGDDDQLDDRVRQVLGEFGLVDGSGRDRELFHELLVDVE